MRLGERQGGAEGSRRLAEAVQAYRQALTVFTRADLPRQWASTQNNLGNALVSLVELQEDAEGSRRLAEAEEAYRQALTIFTRADLPQYWVATQNNLGRALQIQIRLNGFPKGLEQVDRLSQAEGLRDDPVAQASLGTLALVCHVAADQHGGARRAFASLVAHIERQPDDFHLVWDWDPLRSLIRESETNGIKARREPLLRLIDAVSKESRKDILAGLKAVQGALLD
jgi:hypothetical protein